jgi:acyl-CoA hydrolase
MEAKSPKESEVMMTELVLPEHTNAIGTIFGGVVMSWVDIAAAICGFRHARRQVVTASVDAMHFLAPIRLGWVVTLEASVNCVWKSSAEIGVKVTAENPLTGEKFHTASAWLTMVSLDSNGRPTAFMPLKTETENQERRQEKARHRRKVRLELKEHERLKSH